MSIPHTEVCVSYLLVLSVTWLCVFPVLDWLAQFHAPAALASLHTGADLERWPGQLEGGAQPT